MTKRDIIRQAVSETVLDAPPVRESSAPSVTENTPPSMSDLPYPIQDRTTEIVKQARKRLRKQKEFWSRR